MPVVNAGILRYFTSPQGREIWEQALENYADPVDFLLSLSGKMPGGCAAFMAEQLKIRAILKRKFPLLLSRGIVGEKSLAEQATSEAVARYHARCLEGEALCDATGGMGVDTIFFSSSFSNVEYIEKDLSRYQMFLHNLNLLPECANITPRQGDSMEILRNSSVEYEWIFLDPARRNKQGDRFKTMSRWSPDILAYAELIFNSARRVALKISPAYDITLLKKELPGLYSVQVISVSGEVKELLAFGYRGYTGDCQVQSVCLNSDGSPGFFIESRNAKKCPLSSKGAFLYEPDPAIIKACLIDELGEYFDLNRYSQYGVFLISNRDITNFPGRKFRIHTIFSWSRSRVKRYITDRVVSAAAVICRDFPVPAAVLRKKFGLQESSRNFLIFTRNSTGEKVVLHGEKL
ncbi:MAG: THUMP-like domain-containing protein [Fibrobacterota bacterium]